MVRGRTYIEDVRIQSRITPTDSMGSSTRRSLDKIRNRGGVPKPLRIVKVKPALVSSDQAILPTHEYSPRVPKQEKPQPSLHPLCLVRSAHCDMGTAPGFLHERVTPTGTPAAKRTVGRSITTHNARCPPDIKNWDSNC